jgi:hypothetical protein
MIFKKIIQMVAGIVILSIIPALSSCSNIGQLAGKPQLQRFALSEPATALIKDKALINSTVLQSFAFDNVNQHIYLVQLIESGRQLPGESQPVIYQDRLSNGDLAVTKLDFSGNILGHMYLKGFGHGVSIGVEPVGDTAYLWTETDAVKSSTTAESFGSQLARFKFDNEKILTKDSPELEKHRLIENSGNTTVNIDSTEGLLLLRYNKAGVFYFSVYPLEEVKQKKYTPISTVQQPKMGTFQGFTFYGNYLYLLEGNRYGVANSPRPTGNTFITSVDIKTGNIVEKQLITAAADMIYREPEGMSILIRDIKQPQKAELGFGLVSGQTDARLVNIYTLNRFAPAEDSP